MPGSTEVLSVEDVSLLQGLQKKDYVVCYAAALFFIVTGLVLFCLTSGTEGAGVGIIFLSLSGLALFMTLIGRYMQKQYQSMEAVIAKGEKRIYTGLLLAVVRQGYDRARYRFENSIDIDVYLPIDLQHKRPLRSITTLKNCVVTLQATTGDQPVLLEISYAGAMSETVLQPATDQDHRQLLKGEKSIAWIIGVCLAFVFLIIGIFTKWSAEVLMICFGLPACLAVVVALLLYIRERKFIATLDEHLTVRGTVTEIIYIRVKAGKYATWHYFYRIGPYTFDAGTVSKASPGAYFRVELIRAKNGKGQRILSLQPDHSGPIR